MWIDHSDLNCQITDHRENDRWNGCVIYELSDTSVFRVPAFKFYQPQEETQRQHK